MKILMSTLVVMTAAAGLAVAEDKPNFSGNWKVDADKSAFGPIGASESMMRSVEQKGADISVKQVMTGPDMEFTLKYLADGKETINNFMGSDVKCKASWEGKSLVIRSYMDSEGAKVASTSKWTLSDDGKTWTEIWSVSSPQGDFDVKYVLVKQ
jgi:hypothetical protein